MWIMAKTWTAKIAEIAALTERVSALVTQVIELQALQAKLEEAVAAERARSDSAVDRMLGQKGLPPVTPIKSPTLDDLSSMFEESPEEVAAIRRGIAEHGAAEVLMGTTGE